MEAKAVARRVPISPTKARRVVDEVRWEGLEPNEALARFDGSDDWD